MSDEVIPSRLELARRRRGLTKRSLATLVGLTDRSIAAFESGSLTPSGPTLRRIAEVLGFPLDFFFAGEIAEVPHAAVSFRALSKMTAAQEGAARAAGALALEVSDWIERRFALPTPDVPRLAVGMDPETAAAVVRSEWGLGEAPIANMIHLLELHGVRVFSLAEDARAVDAFSFWRDGKPYIFLNMIKSPEHSRFDAAHELAHLVLHWGDEAPVGRDAEREAHTFASALLMPRAGMIASAPRFVTLTEAMAHKRKWRVSLAAYVYRLRSLELVSEWQYRTLNVELSRRGYRTNEPQRIEYERSQVLEKVFDALRSDGIGRREVAAAVRLPVTELDALVFGLLGLSRVQGLAAGPTPAPAPPPLRVVAE